MSSLLAPTQNIILNFCWIWYNASNFCGSWHQLLTPANLREIRPFYKSSPISLSPQQARCPWSLTEPNLLNHIFFPHHFFTQGLQKEGEQKGDVLRCLHRLPSLFLLLIFGYGKVSLNNCSGRIWELLPLSRAVARARRKRTSNICQPPWKLQPRVKGCWLIIVEMHAKSWEIALERRGRTREKGKRRRHLDSTCCECQRTSLQHCLCWPRHCLPLWGAGSLLFLQTTLRHIRLCSRNSLLVLATDVFHPVSSLPAIPALPGRQNTILICHLLQNEVLCHTKALGFFKLSPQSQGEVGTT